MWAHHLKISASALILWLDTNSDINRGCFFDDLISHGNVWWHTFRSPQTFYYLTFRLCLLSIMTFVASRLQFHFLSLPFPSYSLRYEKKLFIFSSTANTYFIFGIFREFHLISSWTRPFSTNSIWAPSNTFLSSLISESIL